MTTFLLTIFPLFWLTVLAVIHLLLTKRKKINYKLLLLYVSLMAMIGPVGEIVVGTLYESIIGSPLWQYKVLPTHNAYTSFYAPVIWGAAGVYLYYIHEILQLWNEKSRWQKATLRMLETISVEAVLNVSFLVFSGGLIFYYAPGDLWHVTSLQTLPFYFMLGFVVTISVKNMRKHKRFFSAMCLSLMFVIVYLNS